MREMSIMNSKMSKLFLKRHLYVQLFFTGFAFVLMTLLSYLFVNRIVKDNILRNTENVLDYLQAQIETDITELKTTLGSFSQGMRSMLLNGEDSDKLRYYTDEISIFLRSMERSEFSVNGVYGYIDKFPGGPVFLNGLNMQLPNNYSPTERPWYKVSLMEGRGIIETAPYRDMVTNEIIITYLSNIYDEKGSRLGVVCVDARASYIGEKTINMIQSRNGFGYLATRDLTLLAHSNPEFSGMKLSDPIIPLSIFTSELLEKETISEAPLVNWKGEPAVYFARRLPNGWYLGFLTIKSIYYQKVREMAVTLGILGIALATVLIMVLIKVDDAKNKSNMESRHKSAFLANMSHEIRTPMNAIIGMVTIGRSVSDIERKDYCLSKIGDASNHLLGVINDILDMSKIEANKFDLSPVEFVFEKMIQRVLNVINFRVDGKNQKLSVYIDKNIPKTLIGDDQRLAQVLTNLLGNAIKFTPEKGFIALDARFAKEEDGVCILQISVSDTGIGISPEQQAKLFQSFEQAESNTTRKYGGTGLGLAISKNIVEMMGGQIWIKSEVGKGSTFIFTVQMKRAAEITDESMKIEEKQADKIQVSKGVFAGRRLLLVEDVEINREIVQSLLEPTQLQIDCAENGAEAVRIFTENPDKYDIIFMDVQMPEMDGYEATRRIRSFEKERNSSTSFTEGETRSDNRNLRKQIPIIAMTANVFHEDIERCAEVGMDSHLGKPIDINEVIAKLNKYLT
jgi:signal transduction histidine kinase/CheY-like chemotaxis protein